MLEPEERLLISKKINNAVMKEKLVFVIGFGIGFSFALVAFLMQYSIHRSPVCDEKFFNLWKNQKFRKNVKILDSVALSDSKKFENWLKEETAVELNDVSYEKWFKIQSMKRSRLDMDVFIYGAKPNAVLESKWLMNKVRITCVVFIEKLKLAKSILKTWGVHCNKLYFFGQHLEDSSLPIIKFELKLTSSWQLLCESMNYIWNLSMLNETNRDRDLEWTIFVKDDTIVLPENLRYIVAPLNYNEDHYLGHAVSLWGQAYNVAEAGYVLSKSAFRKVITMFDNSDKCASGGKYWKKEDFYLGNLIYF